MNDTKYRDLCNFFVSFHALGWYDLKIFIANLQNSGVDADEFANWVAEYSVDVFDNETRLDVCALLLEYIKEVAYSELLTFADEELLEEKFEDIWVYSNYCDSWYQGYDELQDFLEKQDQNKWSPTLKWFYEYL